MTAAERRQQVETLCHEALERDAAAPSAYLAEACGNDEALRRDVEALLAQVAGKQPPRVCLPYPVALGLAYLDALVFVRRRERTRVPLEGVRTAREIRFASSARAIRELGLPQTPLATTLEKAVRWFLR